MKSLNSIAAIFVLLSFKSALACSCLEWTSAADLLNRADALFIGIPKADSEKISEDGNLMNANYKTQMSIVRGYKNTTGKELDVFSWEDDGGNCGVTFKQDEAAFLVAAYKQEDGKLITSACSFNAITPDDHEMSAFVRELNDL